MIGDRQDALRYRWLRERLHSTEWLGGTSSVCLISFLWDEDHSPAGPGPKLDYAIDQMIRAEKK